MANFSLVNNTSASASQARLAVTNNSLNQTIQRLSSGLRINRSGDDAAGLAVANSFRSDVAVLTQGIRNANDGISTLQIVDGGLNTISNLLDRASTLASQSASGTFSGNRTTLNNELTAVLSEIDRQAQNIGLGTGVAGTDPEARFVKIIDTYIGGGADASATGNVVSVDLSSSVADSTGLGINAVDISTEAGAQTAIGTIRAAVTTLGDIQGVVGAGQNNLTQAIDLASTQITNYQAAESAIRDADIAAEASNLARLNTLQQAGVAALAQANTSGQAVLSLLR
ncbi:MAG: flagellin [Acidobacteria bacterium]|nr:flagellin [Acidobacteriota bacterium]